MSRLQFSRSLLNSLAPRSKPGVSQAAPGDIHAAADDPKDLVSKLIKDYSKEYNDVINNAFRKKMETATPTDPETTAGFKLYMIQDFFYLVDLLLFATDRAAKAPDLKTYDSLMADVKNGVDYAGIGLHLCIDSDKIAMPESAVFKAKRAQALIDYVNFVVKTATEKNWIFAEAALIACFQSYYAIASALNTPSIPKGSPWFRFWIDPNSSPDAHKYALDQQQFFIDHYDAWKDHYEELSEIFKEGCKHEIALWNVALAPTSGH